MKQHLLLVTLLLTSIGINAKTDHCVKDKYIPQCNKTDPCAKNKGFSHCNKDAKFVCKDGKVLKTKMPCVSYTKKGKKNTKPKKVFKDM